MVTSRSRNSYMRVAPQRHLAADRHAFAQLEAGDRLLGLGDDRLLPGDQRQLAGAAVDLLLILHPASPTPMLTTIFSSRGTCMAF